MNLASALAMPYVLPAQDAAKHAATALAMNHFPKYWMNTLDMLDRIPIVAAGSG
jgi:hypothetical protein